MRIATWNVNSITVRLPHVLDWLQQQTPDILCLQELKCDNTAFPLAELNQVGYQCIYNGQKTYNGVAVLARQAIGDAHYDIPAFDDPQKRLIAATVDGVRVICAYFPNGSAVGSEKFDYKLRWLNALTQWLADQINQYPQLILTGDFNIAPEDRDAHDQWEKNGLLVSPKERTAFQALLALGLNDAFRLFEQPDNSFSWWDYRQLALQRNRGLRIDHILVSDALKGNCQCCSIDKAPRKLTRPSDHAPVWLDINL